MGFDKYQELAARTINQALPLGKQADHALHGMSSEIGELHGLYQKEYQGHVLDEAHLKKELGDLLWFMAEYCTAMGWDFSEIARINIQKLIDRYPDGFEEERSIYRREGDI